MKRLFSLLLCLVALVPLAACSSGGADPVGPGPVPVPGPVPGPTALEKYACGRWHTDDIHMPPPDGWDLVFSQDMTFIGYAADRPTPTISGTWTVAADGTATGNWTATKGTRVGRFEARFVDAAAKILHFKFIETNAFDNPDAVNGVVSTENQGPNLDASCPPSGGGGGSSVGADAIDPASVTWSGANPAAWPVTATMTTPSIYLNHPAGCTIHNPDICATVGPCVQFDYSAPADWPLVGGKIIGSGWVVAKVNGRWFGGVWEGIVPGGSYFTTTEQCPDQTAQFVQAASDEIAGHTFVSGEEIGFMLSTVARGPHPAAPVGRSRIVKITYP